MEFFYFLSLEFQVSMPEGIISGNIDLSLPFCKARRLIVMEVWCLILAWVCYKIITTLTQPKNLEKFGFVVE